MEPVSDPRVYSNRYQVTHLIARGGMALVYRAQDLLLNRPVALKILYPELSADPLFVERFRREAQAAANLSHPNIVPVFDWGEDDGTYFIVMELVDGTSLAEVLRGSRTLTGARSAALVAQVAAALGYAHRSGVVHRDVKPGNILITSDGQVKVTDFGIAQAMASEDHLAEAGSVMGTATYFSPEQAEGAALDGRSDVYSLGVVLFEMLVGRPPFIGDSPVEVSSQHVHSVVPLPSEFNATIAHDLEAIVMEALAKSPAQRYQTADEMRSDLLRFSEGQPVRAAERDGAFFGADATRAVATVTDGPRTEAVPVTRGPRTATRRPKKGRAGLIVALVIIVLAAGAAVAAAYVFATRSPSISSMPNVIGQSTASASLTLRNDGLKILGITQIASKKAKGTVVATVPNAGASVSKGDSVRLKVSLGKVPKPVKVPDVTKMSVSAAVSTLGSLHLGSTVQVTTTIPIGANPNDVLSQSPISGTMAHTGDTVTLYILKPGTTFPMPSLTGQTQANAANVIRQDGLTLSQFSNQLCSDTVASQLVLKTVPAAGLLVKPNTLVRIVMSSGYCNVYVPNVTFMPQATATTALTNDNLIANVSTAPPQSCLTVTPGDVASQTVPPGSSVPYNSRVGILVCPVTPASTAPSG